MAEIVPNRVPCGKKPTPTPPQPEPTPVTLCDITGIKYFKLQSQIPGDYTKNCGLLGNEIDENFYFLRSMDIKTAYTIDEEGRKILVLERVNCGREIKVDITDDDAYQFRLEDGYMYITFPDGHEEKIGRFLVEGDNVHIVTDASIQGDGSYGNPIGVDLAYRTGTYAPADFYADLTCTSTTVDDITSNLEYGHAFVSRENVSRFGALYTWDQANKLNDRLKSVYGEKGWRLPSTEDWAQLLNWAESNVSAKTHDTRTSGNWGCEAGQRLKSKEYWYTVEEPVDTKPYDDFGMAIYPVGVCPENYNTKEPQKFGFTGLYKVTSFWTSTLCERDGEPYARTFSYGHNSVAQFTENRKRRLSIRLVRDIDADFDVKAYEFILGNYIPVTLTTDGKQLWTSINISIYNYDGYDAREITIPEEWQSISTKKFAKKYFELVESGETFVYEEIEEDKLHSYYEDYLEKVDEVPANPDSSATLFVYTEEEIYLDVVTEPKFFYNAWDGKEIHKKLMREGESVVLLYEDFETGCDTAATPYVTNANTNHEWRVFVNPQTGLDELIDTVEALKREMDKEFKEIHELISGLTENVNNLSGFVGDMYDEMQSGFTSAFTEIENLQRELDMVEESVGLDNDGNYNAPKSGLTSGSTSVMDAISILDEAITQAIEDIQTISGMVEDSAEKIENIISGVGLDYDGSYVIKSGTTYLDEAESVEEEIVILDDVVASAMTEIEELQKRTIEPLDESIVVEVSGYTTYVGVQLDATEDEVSNLSNTKHIVLGENGLWFNGDFKLESDLFPGDDEDFYPGM